jgi:hypothetical protein
MAQTLPEGAFVLPADMERIEAAQRDLLNTNDANGSVLVRVNLHVHYEYPKHITIGKETVVVNSAEEEARLTAPAAAVPESPADSTPASGDDQPPTESASAPATDEASVPAASGAPNTQETSAPSETA